ncbi:uncharacterized protein PGRI_044050 [Penicillium griseofulvum]|uniref:Myb-like DNA-binding domain-containing protein n=1 Tax=Penicillium patulum TaxID=5078 RepID=A0A135LNV1_PENPA|nr:uncharacterized protein PGRI_044050 [Penicillium griseofulvum]KXG50638.1 hypothetical protein PGRI_044050 [Penicillium griseofulvum]
MATNEQSTPKAKVTKSTTGRVVKRIPVKTSSAKTTPGYVPDKDLVFLWKCIKMSTGVKIDWAAVADDAGKSVNTIQKQYSRLNIKLEKYVATMRPGVASETEDDTNDKAVQAFNPESD